MVIHDLRNPTSQISFAIKYALEIFEKVHQDFEQIDIDSDQRIKEFLTGYQILIQEILKEIENYLTTNENKTKTLLA